MVFLEPSSGYLGSRVQGFVNPNQIQILENQILLNQYGIQNHENILQFNGNQMQNFGISIQLNQNWILARAVVVAVGRR